MSEGPVTPHNERFAEVLSGLLFDLLKAAGVNWQPIKAMERIRDTGRRMARVIEFHAERKAVEVARKLQTATRDAFQAMEKDNAELKKRVKELEDTVVRWGPAVDALEKKNEDPTRRSS